MNPLADLQAIMREFSQRVILQAIWFVDRPGERYRLEAELRRVTPDVFKQTGLLPGLAGIPVYEFFSFHASADEWQKWPWIVLWPGVWLKYSDGTYTRWAQDTRGREEGK